MVEELGTRDGNRMEATCNHQVRWAAAGLGVLGGPCWPVPQRERRVGEASHFDIGPWQKNPAVAVDNGCQVGSVAARYVALGE